MRVKLRDDLMYVAVEDGVYLETGTADTRLTGSAAYGLIQRLAPHLDGRRTIEALTAGLPPAQQRIIADLARMLVERGIARDLDQEPPHGLLDWELDRYRESVAFAEHVADAPLHRFETFRNSRVLLVGAGQGMTTLVQTLFELGLRSVTLVETAEAPTAGEAYRRVLDLHRRHDPTAELHLPETGVDLADDTHLAALVDGYDAVLHCTDRPMAGRARRLNRVARARGVPVLQALAAGDDAWIGPSLGGTAGGCWECAARARRDAGRSGQALPDDDRPDLVPPCLTAPVGALVGAALGFAYLRHRVGATAAATNSMTRVDLETAVTSEHLLDVHPGCSSCPSPTGRDDGVADRVRAMAGRAPVDLDTFVARVPTLIDPLLGPLLDIGTGAHSQVSVSCVAATVADLAGTGAGPTVVTAVGGGRKQALVRAAVAAVELLAAGVRAAAPTDGATDGAGPQWWDAAAGAVVAADPAVTRIAAGFTFAEAQGRALLKLRHAAAVAPHPAGTTATDDPPGTWLERARWPEPVRDLAQDAALLGHALRAWCDASGTPTVFVGTGAGWLAHACAPDLDTALERATQAAVATLTDRTPSGGDVGPDLGAGDWDVLLPTLLRELTGAGQRLLLRPVGEIPAVRRVVPFAVEAALVPRTGRIA